MESSLVRELCRIQDTLRTIVPFEIWQSWALANEEIIEYLQKERN